jgi:ABC-type dipeptide/oligopeptide/nickel transport system permease component
MTRFIARRLFTTLVTLFVLSIVTFLVLRVAPGSPCQGWMTKEACEALRQEQGWYQPYFPVSFDASAGDLLWLPVIVAAAAAFIFVRRWRGHAGQPA